MMPVSSAGLGPDLADIKTNTGTTATEVTSIDAKTPALGTAALAGSNTP